MTTLGLGLRRGEALGLRWSDIDWTNRTVTIAGQLQRVRRRSGVGGTQDAGQHRGAGRARLRARCAAGA